MEKAPTIIGESEDDRDADEYVAVSERAVDVDAVAEAERLWRELRAHNAEWPCPNDAWVRALRVQVETLKTRGQAREDWA